MKVDLGNGLVHQNITERKTPQVSTGDVSASKTATVDRTTLSTSLPTVSSLVKQSMQTPAVRHDKVNALRQAISSGSYQLDHVKIAGAVANEI